MDAFGGHGIPPADGGVIPIGMAGYSPGIGLEYDVELGRQYLAEAGYPDGQHFPHLSLSVSPGTEMAAAGMKRQWNEALGIDFTFQKTTISVDPTQIPEIQAMCMGWTADYPDPDNFLRQSAVYNNLSNWGWSDARYEELIKTAAYTPDRPLRIEMYRQADRLIVAEEAMIVPIGYGNVHKSIDLVKPWVKNWYRNALGEVRFKNIVVERD